MMKQQSLPKPNTQAISWFYGEQKRGTLLLNPKYQRNPIWSSGQKCFLIDSLISGAPIPQVFINVKTSGVGRNRTTTYEVVDGQQRLRAILEFMDDDYPLIMLTTRSYPVSAQYGPHVGKCYSELPPKIQERIWNYPLAVQELRGWSDTQIRALFRRLNYVVERLSKQELRHSQYFGEFVAAVESLAKDEFWDDVQIFTRRDSQRMKDVEFVSELLVLLMAGIQDGQKSLDEFYAKYDVAFGDKAAQTNRFRQVLASLRTIQAYLTASRFRKKADFYALFAAAARVNGGRKKPRNLEDALPALRLLEQGLEEEPEDQTGEAARYYSTVVEGPNKRAKREARTQVLEDILR